MKPKLKPRFFPPRTLGQLMALVALCGVVLAVVVPRGGGSGGGAAKPIRGRLGTLRLRNATIGPPRLSLLPPAQTAAGDDPMVVVAATEIDDAFLIPAPVEIDDAMIVRADRLGDAHAAHRFGLTPRGSR